MLFVIAAIVCVSAALAEPPRLPKPKIVKVNNTQIHYVESGRGEAVVFIHGTPGDYRAWAKQIAPFALSYRVIAYSRRNCFPNHAAGTASGDSLMTHVRDLDALLRALHIPRAHLVGDGYGAAIALMTAIRHPHLVRSLVLHAPFMMPAAREDRKADTLAAAFVRNHVVPARKAFRANNLKEGVRSVVNGLLDDQHGFDRLPGDLRSVLMQNANEVKVEASAHNPIPPIGSAEAEKVQAPVLLLHGERGPFWFDRLSEKITSSLEHMEQAAIPGTSFGAPSRNASEFNHAALAFLARH